MQCKPYARAFSARVWNIHLMYLGVNHTLLEGVESKDIYLINSLPHTNSLLPFKFLRPVAFLVFSHAHNVNSFKRKISGHLATRN